MTVRTGAKVIVAGPKGKTVYRGGKDILVSQIFPDKLRLYASELKIIQEFDKANKMIAFICHAGWLPISAKVLKGMKCTSWQSIKDDIVNAGSKWVDQAVVVDRHFISSRNFDDLPKFCLAIVEFSGKKRTKSAH